MNVIPWHLGVFDAHCHPTDTLASLQSIPSMRANVLTVMATRGQDQDLVAEAADNYGVTQQEVHSPNMTWSEVHKIVPAFGWHPWFSYQMYEESSFDGAVSLTGEQKVQHYQRVLTPKPDDRDFLLSLPEPRPFAAYLARTRDYLIRYPLALIGEVGLDRSFRLPVPETPAQEAQREQGLTPGGREGRQLSPYRVPLDHQRKILLAQLRLAGEMRRAVSVHGVAAHGAVFDALAETWKGHEKHVPSKRERRRAEAANHAEATAPDGTEAQISAPPSEPLPCPPRVCLHSFSGPAETVKMYIDPQVPCEVFFSFSTTINTWSENPDGGKVEAAVRAVPDDRILIESDLHTAGDRMDDYLAEIIRKLCEVRGWEVEEGVRILGANWRKFVFG
ncbi:hypothetical protein LTR62_006852 [Meristemomyces frigidus]|uniref:Metallo-dependent hydrolase n=1 Tax=Meristemomyces frigidus TaxID=1508187 RepID=A0AAN7TFW5_9PEZI|nr:hypothetical protein LTR62_006852 [Meristemomyces frigidus]